MRTKILSEKFPERKQHENVLVLRNNSFGTVIGLVPNILDRQIILLSLARIVHDSQLLRNVTELESIPNGSLFEG